MNEDVEKSGQNHWAFNYVHSVYEDFEPTPDIVQSFCRAANQPGTLRYVFKRLAGRVLKPAQAQLSLKSAFMLGMASGLDTIIRSKVNVVTQHDLRTRIYKDHIAGQLTEVPAAHRHWYAHLLLRDAGHWMRNTHPVMQAELDDYFSSLRAGAAQPAQN